MLIYAIASITSALVFYTIGVWSEKLQGELKQWHLIAFWIGLLFDTLGTTLMGFIAGGGFNLGFHSVTGVLAIVLMLFHATWATIVMRKNIRKTKLMFHKFSLAVWLVWLVPFLSGAVFGMAQ